LNQRPFGPQPNALPDCATPRGGLTIARAHAVAAICRLTTCRDATVLVPCRRRPTIRPPDAGELAEFLRWNVTGIYHNRNVTIPFAGSVAAGTWLALTPLSKLPEPAARARHGAVRRGRRGGRAHGGTRPRREESGRERPESLLGLRACPRGACVVPRTRVPGRSRRKLPRVGNARESGARSERPDTGDTPGRLVGSLGTPA
jgi:hypothetical protein